MRILLALLIITSCSSYKEYAQELTKEGLCEIAIYSWVDALKEEPRDQEVHAGIRHCQNQILGDRLESIEEHRKSGDLISSLADLTQIHNEFRQWGIVMKYEPRTELGREMHAVWRLLKISTLKAQSGEGRERANALVLEHSEIFKGMPDYRAFTQLVLKKEGV